MKDSLKMALLPLVNMVLLYATLFMPSAEAVFVGVIATLILLYLVASLLDFGSASLHISLVIGWGAGQYMLVQLIDKIYGLQPLVLPIMVTLIYAVVGTMTVEVWNYHGKTQGATQAYKRFARVALITTLIFIINLFLIINFNTLLWPYLWPRPMLFYIVGIIAFLLWYRQYAEGPYLIRIVGIGLIFVGESYFFHAISIFVTQTNIISFMHLVGYTGIYSVMLLNFINQSRPQNNNEPPVLDLDNLPHVVAVVPTYGEPVHILENTLISLSQLNYPDDKLHIILSDDAHRPELLKLTNFLGVDYNFGAQRDAKAGNLNSALLYISEKYPDASLILTQDADELIHPEFLQKTVGYFQQNPNLGILQTPKEAYAPHDDPFGTRDRVFYDITQVGRNGAGSAFACGSAVIWKIQAVQEIGGYSTWNVVEDLTTSYLVHAAGYDSQYHNEVLSIGLAPDDIPGLLKQRGTWAVDNWRLFLFDNPLFKQGLRWEQRLQYFELGMFHVSTALFTPLIMLVPVISILTDQYLEIEGAALYPWILFSALYYLVLAHGRISDLVRMWQFWIGHSPTFIKAFFIAIGSRHKKPKYVVTRKTRQNGFYGKSIWMQFLYLGLVFLALLRIAIWPPSASPLAVLSNVAVMLFFAYMISAICRASFYKISFKAPVSLRRWGTKFATEFTRLL